MRSFPLWVFNLAKHETDRYFSLADEQPLENAITRHCCLPGKSLYKQLLGRHDVIVAYPVKLKMANESNFNEP